MRQSDKEEVPRRCLILDATVKISLARPKMQEANERWRTRGVSGGRIGSSKK